MIIVSYDISDDKKRNKFAKYLTRFGHRIQYSVFEIENNDRILNNIFCDIRNKFEKTFEQSDSVYVFQLSSSCRVQKFGYAKNEDTDMIIIQ
jgi:CRISPR-associated protein Cas2